MLRAHNSHHVPDYQGIEIEGLSEPLTDIFGDPDPAGLISVRAACLELSNEIRVGVCGPKSEISRALDARAGPRPC